MTQMLTAKEIQAILEIDRSTVYRMAEDGRLPAVKVGRQWRFPSEQINAWLAERQLSHTPQTPTLGKQSIAAQFPVECVQMVQDTFAEALGVMLIITDMNGKPMTQFSNPCGLFSALATNEKLWQKCMIHWQEMADFLSLQPQYVDSYLGLLCTRAYIRSGAELKGMVFAGGIAPEVWPVPTERLENIATDLDVSPHLITNHLDDVFFLSADQKAHVLTLVQKVANVVSHILHERERLLA